VEKSFLSLTGLLLICRMYVLLPSSGYIHVGQLSVLCVRIQVSVKHTRFVTDSWINPLLSVHRYTHILKVKVKAVLRPTISRPVLLGVRYPVGTRDQYFTFSL
jgi:hypothetical protein